MSGIGIPIDIEKSEISTRLNSVILNVFLVGMYTIIYVGTLYIYFTRNSPNRRLVPATITLLFSTNIVNTGLQWYLIKREFIDNGDTRDSVWLSYYATPPSIDVVVSVSQYVGFVLADGLLIWRCYSVWNRSIRIISIPLLLLVVTAGLFFADIVIDAIFTHRRISPGQAARFNHVAAAAYFISFATSLIAMIPIAYRIYSVSKESLCARRFKHILDIMVQSGVVYPLVMLMAAISFVVPGTGNVFNTTLFALTLYTSALTVPITGMLATIMVARVALLAPDATFTSTSVHLSGLQFHAPTHQTEGHDEVETTHSMNIDRNLHGGGQVGEGKIQ